MGLSFSHLVIILIIVLVLFGAGKLPQMMADIGKGMKAFKKGIKDEENQEEPESKSVPKLTQAKILKKKPSTKKIESEVIAKKPKISKAKTNSAKAKTKI